ncbi:MAG: sigma-70 family RNA polymerase sigma factor [Bacteroides sp.]|nr:sigma-70 family RNA polymerase sigma factor [Eubacterium sp.]MCM1418046.1 sigma-70 family RNA polymerase sigma factor [Roseburia sp.]MCM1462190.1 sigma-70 family RNA polymerase sigma factor [Bacteroides sp.]
MIAFFIAMIDEPEEKADFESLYRTYKDRLFSLAFRILGNHHDAEEAVSQAFFTVARSFSKISPLGTTEREAYLKIVIRNAAIDLYRREKKDPSFALDEMDELGAVSEDVSDEVLSKLGYERVVEAIRALPERYAEPLYLFHVRELNVKEIAAILAEQEETVKKQLQRARKKLRVLLEEDGIIS